MESGGRNIILFLCVTTRFNHSPLASFQHPWSEASLLDLALVMINLLSWCHSINLRVPVRWAFDNLDHNSQCTHVLQSIQRIDAAVDLPGRLGFRAIVFPDC